MRKSNGIVKKQMTNRTQSVNKILKKIWITAAVLIILAAVFSSIFRSLTPWAKQYKGEVEQHLSLLLGQPVTIQTMETGWYWFQPVLKLKQVIITDDQKKSLHLDKLLIGINLFKSLWHWQIQPGVLYIEDIHLILREKDGHWHVDGISTNAISENEMTPERTLQVISWLAQQERLIIRHVSAHLHFSDGGLIPVTGLNISIVNSGGNYKLKGEARLDQTNATSFQLLGALRFDPYHFEQTNGQIYFSAKRVVPSQWQSMFPTATQRFEGGKGNIDLWVDFKNGVVSLVQAQLKFKRLAWHLLNMKNSQIIQSLSANLAWKPEDTGWQFNADHIKLRVGGYTWPENQLLIKFDTVQNAYQLFVKSVVIESLLSEVTHWPEAVQKIIDVKPQGSLTDTQIVIKDNQLNSILTRFDQLGWKHKDNIPQVDNLSGVLNWQSEAGRLELDSENTSITFTGYPTQKLDLLNGAVEWKELSNGLRVSIERFALSQPELTISAEGVVDEVTRHSIGHIRLDAGFSGKNLQQWLTFLPKHYLKPKLDEWLKQDIKRIGEASGKVIINGFAKDFPFDNNTGEFSIISHASGGEILITPKWQLINELEGYITLKNRNLDINLVHGDFHGVPVQQMNLRIDDIGKDKETLLIHSIIHAPINKMMDFVIASPLNKKLAGLKMLGLKGLGLLNLRLEVPLYPENDDVLVKGDLTFKKNTVLVKHQIGSLTLEDLSGALSFDEKGVTQSALTATLFGYPLNIKIQSIKGVNPYTTVLVVGECTVESLKSKFNLPVFAFLKGMFSLQASFKLTDDPNDLDSLKLTSTLRGLAINLPAPLGKLHHDKVPLEVNVDFNPKKAIRLRANYDGRLSTDIWFQERKAAFELKSGQVRLGSAHALDQNKPGLAVVGTLKGFDLQAWKEVLAQFPADKTNSYLMHKLRIINVTLGKLTFLQQQFDQLIVKAKILPDNDWAFSLEQKNIIADLTYHPATNALNGYVKQLHLAKMKTSTYGTSESSFKVHPAQIPNLNLRIDNVSVGKIQVGDVTLKSHSTADRWLIDYCRIESPVYQFNVQGDWSQKNNKNLTQLQVKLHLIDLAKSLQRWQITPAVDAGKGDMEFKGGWNNSVFNFSLAALNGNMYLKLNNGIITDLSPETEEKLGLGKLLSILSLQTIPRRLKLDFSDLSHQGYSFDVFKGNFSITKGIMTTQDSYLDGPVAYASMKGSLNLVKRMYDLNLSISPHITASLPLVATIAGGPIAGLAAWVANKIINQSMQRISAYSYKISGPWSQPVVQQLSIVKKIMKK